VHRIRIDHGGVSTGASISLSDVAVPAGNEERKTTWAWWTTSGFISASMVRLLPFHSSTRNESKFRAADATCHAHYRDR